MYIFAGGGGNAAGCLYSESVQHFGFGVPHLTHALMNDYKDLTSTQMMQHMSPLVGRKKLQIAPEVTKLSA